jgi:hypothetical protein
MTMDMPEWTLDCNGKQDYDADIVRLSTRYWPGSYGQNGWPSAMASILLFDDTIAVVEFTAPTESGVKTLVETWAADQFIWIRERLTPPTGGEGGH